MTSQPDDLAASCTRRARIPRTPGNSASTGVSPGRGISNGTGRTTLRFYDPPIAAWRSTRIDPLNGRVRRFISRPDGADIVSGDDRRTWHLDEQMFIRRHAA